MKISHISNVMYRPNFSSRSRVGQDNVNKVLEGQLSPSPAIEGNLSPVDSVLLFHRFDFYDIKNNGVDPADRTYDSFTGLRDKNYLLAALDIEMQNAQRDDKPLSIAMFDMDNFKSVNELLGYETGDKFIKEISKDISEITKENKLDLYRFGGEEFIIIFGNQSDAKKEEIAKAIAEKTNSNETVQSYSKKYMRNAQSRLDKALYSTAKVHKISELNTKKETIKEIQDSLSSEETKNDPFFDDAIKEIDIQMETICRNLIDERLEKEQNEQNISMLTQTKSKLMSGEKLLKSEQRTLVEYLFSVYDKANEIYQTKKWINDFRQNGGFGITCGVITFGPESLEYKNPMDVIGIAGRVLKNGKNTRKGQVYLEKIR